MKKKKSVFDLFEDHVTIAEWHKPIWEKPTKRFLEQYKKRHGFDFAGPCNFHPFLITWSMKGVGFGEYCFWRDDKGRIFCQNEAMGRDSIKKVLNLLVDRCILADEMTPGMRAARKRRYPKEGKKGAK